MDRGYLDRAMAVFIGLAEKAIIRTLVLLISRAFHQELLDLLLIHKWFRQTAPGFVDRADGTVAKRQTRSAARQSRALDALGRCMRAAASMQRSRKSCCPIAIHGARMGRAFDRDIWGIGRGARPTSPPLSLLTGGRAANIEP